ncbi:MAG: SurA N-terminal domain-containing protein [Maricaulaceae bacterium]
MLTQLRSAGKSAVAIVFIGLLVASFAFFGVSDVFRIGAGDAAATVGGRPISVQSYSEAFRNRVRSQALEDPGFTSERARAEGLDRQVLFELITDVTIETVADRLGLTVSDRAISEEIRNAEVFQDPVRQVFSEDAYYDVLARNRQTPAAFEANIRADMVRQQLLIPAQQGLAPPAAMLEQSLLFFAEQRRALALIVPADAAPPPEPVKDADVRAAYEAQADRLIRPEARAIDLVRFEVDDFVGGVDIDEAELRAAFEYRQETEAEPERRTFVQIPAEDEAAAESLAARLALGDQAEEAAAAIGAVEPLRFSAVPQAEVIDLALASAVFSLPQGASQAVEGDLGWAAIRVDVVTPGETLAYEDIVDELRRDLAREEAEQALFDALSVYEDERAGGASLIEAAQAANAPVLSFPPVDRTGATRAGGPIAELTEVDGLLAAIFDTDPGFEPDLLLTETGGYVGFDVTEVSPQEPLAFEDVEADLRAALEAQARTRAADGFAEALRERIAAGEDPNAIAETFEPAGRVEIVIATRSQGAPSLGGRTTAALFAARLGDVVIGPAAEAGDRVIARLDAIEPPDPALAAQFRPILEQSLTQALVDDVSRVWLGALQDDLGVEINERGVALALGESPAPS